MSGTRAWRQTRTGRLTQLTLENGANRRFLNTVHPYEARTLTLLGVEADVFITIRPTPP